MKPGLVICLMTFSALLLNCSSSSMDVKTNYDRQYDFSVLRTYRWPKGEEVNPNDRLVRTPMAYKAVREAVDRRLSEKGFVLVDSETPDLVVVAHAGLVEQMQIDQGPSHYDVDYVHWYNPWWGPYGGWIDVGSYEEGTLVLDIVSFKTKELAWRGLGSGLLDTNRTDEQTRRIIESTVAKILINFPPEAKQDK